MHAYTTNELKKRKVNAHHQPCQLIVQHHARSYILFSQEKLYFFISKAMKEICIFDFSWSLISPWLSLIRVQNLLKFQIVIMNLSFMLSLSLSLSRVYQGPCCRVILAFCPPPLILFFFFCPLEILDLEVASMPNRLCEFLSEKHWKNYKINVFFFYNYFS